MNNTIKQHDVNNAAWAACDTFRGVMDAAGYKDYILVMLFLKSISDAWKDHSGKNQNTLLDEHLQKILHTYEQRKDVDKYAHLASFEEIQENDFNLNIPRYVDTFEEAEEIDIAAVQQELDQLEGELVEVRAKMAAHLHELGVTK